MKKAEPVDEFAKTEVLVYPESSSDRDADTMSLYAEYEREIADDAPTRRDLRTRRR